jgi:chromosomal replication initiator protein
MNKKQVWQAALGELEVILSKANFTTWFKDTSLTSYKEGIFTIRVPNAFTEEWLKNKYHNQIIQALSDVTDQEVKEVNYTIGTSTTFSETLSPKTILSTEELTTSREKEILNGELNSKYTFSNFVVGGSNRLAYAASQAVAKSPGKTYNPLFLFGGVGLGKTHLMQAIGNEVVKKIPHKKVTYLPCEKFVNEFIHSIQTRNVNGFKKTYRNVDLLLVDDIQFLSGKESTQEEFFHTFNTLHQSNKQIVISSDRPPKAISLVEDRLISRFEWGMIADIQPPDLETREAILREKCENKGYKLPEDILDYIARSIQHNIRELEGALTRIIAYCELNDVTPSLAVATEILKSTLTPPQKTTLNSNQILQTVADFFSLSIEDLRGKIRKKEIVNPRQIAMYLLREEISQSYPKIAEIIGKKDHTTIIYAYEKIKKEIKEDENTRQQVNLIREKLYSE